MKTKTARNKRIMRMVEAEGRTFYWIAEQLGISDTMVRRIYHREKELARIASIADKVRSKPLSMTAPVAMEGGESER